MSQGFCSITLVGWAGRDAEWREHNGQGILTVSIGCTSSWQKADGTWKNDTVWFKASRWYKNPEHAKQAAEKIKKFDIVAGEGDITHSEHWTDRDGNVRVNNAVKARRIVRLAKGETFTGRGEAQPEQSDFNEMHDEDIPF